MPGQEVLRRIPSVSALLGDPSVRALLSRHPRAVVVKGLRRVLEGLRREAADPEGGGAARSREAWSALAASRLPGEIAAAEGLSFRRVLNATGVVIHTNLGRAPLAEEALEAIRETASGYSNLEYDLSSGRRSTRLLHVEAVIRDLAGAEAAHVVNNNAGAVLLCLAALARGRDVVVSRGELVEIGGSFRVPDIMAESGATLVEVGTTNRTRLADYEKAIGPRTALLLKVHRSNFAMTGFTEEVEAGDLAALGRRTGIAVLEDLGSGALFDFGAAGIPGTPTMRRALAAGPDLVTASGDKLLGGPQAGIIVGRASVVEPLRRHPLSRALRLDKLCLAAMAATLRLYADPRRAAARVPVVRMLTDEEAAVRARARRLLRAVARGAGAGKRPVLSLERAFSSPGGGAMPEVALPTACVALSVPGIRPEELDGLLRRGDPPVVGRLSSGKLLLDLRTVGDDEVPELAGAILAAARGR